MPDMIILACETKVTFGKSPDIIEGWISATLIRHKNVEYEISYFASGELKRVWMSADEFCDTSSAGRIVVVGFVKTLS